MDAEARRQLYIELLSEVAIGIRRQPWHWYAYHFTMLPPHPFARSFIEACVDCEAKLPGLGRQLLCDLAAIGGIERHLPHYDQLLQKLSEILVLRELLFLPWPDGTTFEHEPAVTPQGKRPELRVVTPERHYLFEVKAPSLTEHARNRATNGLQAPVRMFDRTMLDRVAGAGGLTLPRDNPVKDFLVDANKKFADFKATAPAISVLVIVWDDHVYEPIAVLTQQQCGLLTPASYFRGDNGQPVTFNNIDAVVLVRHLLYFQRAAGDQPLVERAHAFDFGDENALPNVYIPVAGGVEVPAFITDGLRTRPLHDPFLQSAAEYQPVEMVFWINLREPPGERP
jgi:hypothetical protein